MEIHWRVFFQFDLIGVIACKEEVEIFRVGGWKSKIQIASLFANFFKTQTIH